MAGGMLAGYSTAIMPMPRSTSPNQRRPIFLAGLAGGVVLCLLVAALTPDSGVSAKDLERVESRLAGIEQKLTTPTPSAQPSAEVSPGAGVKISAINKDPTSFIGQTVELQGRINSPYEGIGFAVVDTDGTFLWVRTKGKLPTGTAKVRGKISELTDQVAQWKNEPGWPENDANLTAKLREEKIFIEAESVS